MRLRLRRRPRARVEPLTDPFRVQSAAPWRPVGETPDVGMLIQVMSPTLGGRTVRARFQQGFQGTHWLLAIEAEAGPTAIRWVDLRGLSSWRYV